MPGELTVGERSLPGLSPSPTGGAEWHLAVTEGPNRDARLDLPPGSYRIGDDSGADILLADHGVGTAGLTLVIPEAGGPALLRAEGPGALFAGRPLRPGASRVVPRGGELRVGTTVIRLDAPVALVARLEGRRRALRWRIAGAILATALLVAAAAFGPRLLSDPGARPERREAAARPGPARVDRDAARDTLSARLQEANLGPDRLRVSDGANGALLVEGRLNAEETARFAEVRRWYDAAYGAGPALVARLGVDIGPPRPALRIRAVSLAPVPYVIAGDGEKYGEGAVLEDGWVIESIERDRVVLRRGSETSVVTL